MAKGGRDATISFNEYSNIILYGRPQADQLMNWIAAKIPGDWETVGIQLKISSDLLDGIKGNTSLGGRPQNMFREVIKLWEKDPQPEAPYNWETILNVLVSSSVNRITLANEISEKINKKISEDDIESSSTTSSNGYYTDDDLKKLCGCGECSLEDIILKGCSKPDAMPRFPILDVTSLPPCKRQQYLYILQKEADEINEAFAILSSKVCDSLIKERINTKSVVAFINSLRQVETSAAPNFVSKLKERLDYAQDMHDVFIVLSKITSWFNHYLLGSLVRRYGTEEDKEAYRRFTEEDVMTYLRRSVTEIPKDAFSIESIEGSGHFRLKLDHPAEHEIISGQQLLNLKGRVAKALEIPMDCLDFKYIDKGCIEVEFSIPLFYFNQLFPLSIDCIQNLASIAIDGPNNIAIQIKSVSFGNKNEYSEFCEILKELSSDLGNQSDDISWSSDSESMDITVVVPCDLQNSNIPNIDEISQSLEDLLLTENSGQQVYMY